MHKKISYLKATNGTRLETYEEIEGELVSFYKDLLTKPNLNRVESINQVAHHILRLIMVEQNEVLLKEITLQELEIVVGKMVEGKAPGPDGFTIIFFHYC